MTAWCFRSKKLSTFEKERIPNKQPIAKTIIISRLLAKKGLFKAPVTEAYLPRISKRKEPLIPGSIIAHIAIIPDIKMKRLESDVSTGTRDTITTPKAQPKKIKQIFFTLLNDFFCFII